ncbi:MAG: alpha/beta hydrolase [Nitrospirae bacterium]|nr:alpha/beta hydrolase [Nitrospirota bacterium]NTW65341.1 alpha/beta hydrolase [Nitrospirota bacterium]
MIKEKPIIFRNNRGQNLSGVVHFPHRETTPPLLIMAHGFTDDKVSDNRLFVRFARRARDQGFAVFRFDFAGSGDSEGEFADMTVTGEIEDLGSAITFARTIPCLEESPVYLIGYSLGGAIALAAATGDERVHGVVCWAPASDLTAVFTAILGSETILAARQGGAIACRNDSKQFLLKSGFFHDLDRHDPARYIKSINPRPVLLIQGAADAKVLPGQTADLFRAAGEPKELHSIADAPHSFAFHEEELFRTTLRRIEEWSRALWYSGDGCTQAAGSA